MSWKTKKRRCPFLRGVLNVDEIHYTNVKFLRKFINEVGKITPSRLTGVSRFYQKRITLHIKYARHLGLLPFWESVSFTVRN